MEVYKNRACRAVEGRWRGWWPFTGYEIVPSVALAIVLAVTLGKLIGLFGGASTMVGLILWRKVDNDRSDYMKVFFRRLWVKERYYSAAEPDEDYVPFDPTR